MKIFERPKNLNGAELLNELLAADLSVSTVADYNDGTIGLDVNDEQKARTIISKHNGTIIASEATIEQKLASVGLNLDDLKTALGLNA